MKTSNSGLQNKKMCRNTRILEHAILWKRNNYGISDVQLKSPLIFTNLLFHSPVLNVGFLIPFSHLIQAGEAQKKFGVGRKLNLHITMISSVDVLSMWV